MEVIATKKASSSISSVVLSLHSVKKLDIRSAFVVNVVFFWTFLPNGPKIMKFFLEVEKY